MDFKQFRLENWKWFEDAVARYGAPSVLKYLNKVCSVLDDLKPGHMYDLTELLHSGNDIFNIHFRENGEDKIEQNVEMFIKGCCEWIMNNQDYVFSTDFTKIIRSEHGK